MAGSADFWVEHLQLRKHPEGGCFREVYRSGEVIHKKGLPDRYSSFRSISTSIYYLLKSNERSLFHRLKSDETWHFYQGHAMQLFLILPDGRSMKVLLGSDPSKKQVLQFTIPRGTWFAAQPEGKEGFSLAGCTVAPGFDFDDFEMAKRLELTRRFPKLKNLIESFTNL